MNPYETTSLLRMRQVLETKPPRSPKSLGSLEDFFSGPSQLVSNEKRAPGCLGLYYATMVVVFMLYRGLR